ncbi:trimeric intracellular cation channel family protein [Luteipulveratus mongoliensis]|uniref:Membrane protein n=1 Tax=Luteipulveratus mongoliensis TaxID=571913 RepID=A0A0K1JKG0_9MICO|nr:TRIC cation channel family protein [Luteipulveratus mongoliensis]AKU17083.1 membrane protein [Luteipulveratus mongoliensis]
MLTANTDLKLVLDLVGVFVFALSGGLVGVRKRLDLVGVLVLAWVAGLGGGVMRDLLIGDVPPVGVSDWRLMLAACLAGLITFWLHPGVARISRFVRVLDAAGLAVFAVAGALKAVLFAVSPVTAVVVGVVTAVGGGVLRDVLVGQVPEVLRRELYAVPALLGALTVVLAARLEHLTSLVVWSAVVLVFIVRMTAVVLDLNAPQPLRTGDPP